MLGACRSAFEPGNWFAVSRTGATRGPLYIPRHHATPTGPANAVRGGRTSSTGPVAPRRRGQPQLRDARPCRSAGFNPHEECGCLVVEVLDPMGTRSSALRSRKSGGLGSSTDLPLGGVDSCTTLAKTLVATNVRELLARRACKGPLTSEHPASSPSQVEARTPQGWRRTAKQRAAQ